MSELIHFFSVATGTGDMHTAISSSIQKFRSTCAEIPILNAAMTMLGVSGSIEIGGSKKVALHDLKYHVGPMQLTSNDLQDLRKGKKNLSIKFPRTSLDDAAAFISTMAHGVLSTSGIDSFRAHCRDVPLLQAMISKLGVRGTIIIGRKTFQVQDLMFFAGPMAITMEQVKEFKKAFQTKGIDIPVTKTTVDETINFIETAVKVTGAPGNVMKIFSSYHNSCKKLPILKSLVSETAFSGMLHLSSKQINVSNFQLHIGPCRVEFGKLEKKLGKEDMKLDMYFHSEVGQIMHFLHLALHHLEGSAVKRVQNVVDNIEWMLTEAKTLLQGFNLAVSGHIMLTSGKEKLLLDKENTKIHFGDFGTLSIKAIEEAARAKHGFELYIDTGFWSIDDTAKQIASIAHIAGGKGIAGAESISKNINKVRDFVAPIPLFKEVGVTGKIKISTKDGIRLGRLDVQIGKHGEYGKHNIEDLLKGKIKIPDVKPGEIVKSLNDAADHKFPFPPFLQTAVNTISFEYVQIEIREARDQN